MNNIEIIIPTEHLDVMCCVENIYTTISNNNKQTETLKQLRDTLLPKLMSGEIDIDKVEV